MSSVSDETEYYSTTPAPEFRAMESPRRTGHPSNKPEASYLSSAAPELAPATAGIHPLFSNGPSRNTETYVGYPINGYSQENEGLATHSDYGHDSIISTIGMTSGYVSPHTSVTAMPSTPLYSFDEEYADDSFSAYPLPDGSVPSYPGASGYDPNMIRAFESLSRLSDSQQQEILAYLQKRRNVIQPAENTLSLGFSGYRGPIPRSNPLLGMKTSQS
jgi:hypothetical protein